MMLVVAPRKKLRPITRALTEIAETTDACVRQLAAWSTQIEHGPIQGKRHLPRDLKKSREAQTARTDLRQQFLRSLPPSHPLYNTPEALAARRLNDKGKVGNGVSPDISQIVQKKREVGSLSC